MLDAEGVVHVPSHLSDAEAACLPCAGVTAWHATSTSANLKPSDTVLTQGTGGVSLFALQFARTRGTRAMITSSSDAKLARARELGAWELINYVTTPEWGIAARGLTDGVGVDHVVELGGAGTLAQSLRAVRMGGHISMIGVLTGPGQADPRPILMKSVRVNGIFVGSRAMFEDMNEAVSVHGLRPVVDRVFPFGELPAALEYMQSGKHFGKIALSA